MISLTLNLNSSLTLDDQQFETICHNNKNLNFERNQRGELIIMSPTRSDIGGKNWSIAGQLWAWNNQYKLGIGFDSSTGFKLPNGAIRSPDVSWIKKENWENLTIEEKRKFAPICPDFVIELLSINDNWDEGKNKMEEYIDNGVKLGWLIDPNQNQVAIYRPKKEVEILKNPQTLSGENILPKFSLDLADIFID